MFLFRLPFTKILSHGFRYFEDAETENISVKIKDDNSFYTTKPASFAFLLLDALLRAIVLAYNSLRWELLHVTNLGICEPRGSPT